MFLSETLLWLAANGWWMFLHISARSSFPEPLDAQAEKELIDRMFQGDEQAQRLLIEHNLRLVAHIAGKYAKSGAEQEDLVSIGSIGLIKAVQTFRPEAGRLSSYAARCIENEIRMYFRANRKRRNTLLFGDSIGQDKDGDEICLADLMGTDADVVPREAEHAIEAARALQLMDCVLEPREAEVLRRRCGFTDGAPQAQREIAQALGISRSYVSRIEKRALQKLREALEGTQ